MIDAICINYKFLTFLIASNQKFKKGAKIPDKMSFAKGGGWAGIECSRVGMGVGWLQYSINF